MNLPESLRKAPLDRKIGLLTADNTEGRDFPPPALEYLSTFAFHRLRWRPVRRQGEAGELREEDFALALLSGLHALDVRFCFLVDASPAAVRVFLGTEPGEKAGAHRALLEGVWGQGTLLEDSSVADHLRGLGNSGFFGALSGDVAPAARRSKGPAPIDGWIRGLHGACWSYLVDCAPVGRARIAEHAALVLSEIGAQQVAAPGHVLHAGKRATEQYQLLLETCLKRLESARLNGAWQVGVYFHGEGEAVVREGLGLLAASLGGSRQAVQPLRTHLCRTTGEAPASMTILGSEEAASLVALPKEEVPGYELRTIAAFDTDGTDRGEGLHFGRIIRRTAAGDNDLRVPVADLTRHGLVAGVTGSGKTTTCFSILEQLQERKIPFLVVESAKSEYRRLMGHDLFRDLLVFTLGDETPGRSAPFRLNPFEVPAGVLVQTHLDHLKSLFRASFVMYAPMPYVLEEALYDVYRDRGWNLSSNSNDRGAGEGMFPTLTDLHEKIGEVVGRLGYDDRISRDILAGLRTRINNLRLGGKGRMLDTPRSLPFDEIMRRPTLLELKKLGSDEEKAFLIGLVLTRIHEHYEAGAERERPPGTLRHLTLVEEAHRLLSHVPETAAEHDGSARGKAVETFCNMLAEIRAYGEGVLVSEQIPTKLARDVLKNSGIKVMHRLVAQDDRDVMGDAMNMNGEQKSFAATLDRGEAVVYAERMDNAFLVAFPLPRFLEAGAAGSPVTGEDLRGQMDRLFYAEHDSVLVRHAGCLQCESREADCGALREVIRETSSSERAWTTYNRFLLELAFSGKPEGLLDDVDRLLLEGPAGRGRDELRRARWCFLVQAAESAFEAQGRLYRLSFPETGKLRGAFLTAAEPLVRDGRRDESLRIAFRELLGQSRARDERPYAGCGPCAKVCLTRYECGLPARSVGVRQDLKYALTKIPDDARMWIELAEIGRRAADSVIRRGDEGLRAQAAVCCLAQAAAALGIAPRLQTKALESVAKVYRERIVKLGGGGG